MTIRLTDIRRCDFSSKQRVGEMTFRENNVRPARDESVNFLIILNFGCCFSTTDVRHA